MSLYAHAHDGGRAILFVVSLAFIAAGLQGFVRIALGTHPEPSLWPLGVLLVVVGVVGLYVSLMSRRPA